MPSTPALLSTSLQLLKSPKAPTADAAKKARVDLPGFDKKGLAKKDSDVWDLKSDDGSAVNTSDGLTMGEAKALTGLAAKDPKAFMQKLLADSANGTPVSLSFAQSIPQFGDARVEMSVYKGVAQMVANIVLDPALAKYADPVLAAPEKQDKNLKTAIKLTLGGKLNDKGGMDEVTARVELTGVPKFSEQKILDTLSQSQADDLKTTLADTNTTPDAKAAAALKILSSAVKESSGMPLQFLIEGITDSNILKLTAEEQGVKGKATLGKGDVDVEVRNLLGTVGPNETGAGGTLKGSVDSADRDTISIGTLAAFTTDKLSVEFGDDGTPKLFKADKNGKKTQLNDHLVEAMSLAPMGMAALQQAMGNGNLF